MDADAPLRVLYVEDDRISALLMAQLLKTEPGIDLRMAETGGEALAQVTDGWAPGLLILDAHLPDTDGHALLQCLRTLPGLAAVPAVMCSADSRAEDLLAARQAGFIDYWVKPVPTMTVLSVLRLLKKRPA